MPTYKLTNRVVIMRPSEQHDFEPVSKRAETVCVAWADIASISGQERVVAQQIYASATYSIIIRTQAAKITPSCYVIADGDRYPITAVVEMDGYLRLLCTKAA